VLFVGMLSGTYSSICIATPVLTQLKEREPQYKALAKRVALRASGGRAAQRAKAKAVQAGTASRGASADTAAAEPEPAEDDAAADTGAFTDQGTDDRVPASRAAGATPRPASGARPGPRQQPRRTSAAKRRPAGKKKRR